MADDTGARVSRTDFLWQMYWAVQEESNLAEIALGAQEGRDAQYGPWDPSECSSVLLGWFESGLVTLYDSRLGHPTNRPDRPGPPSARHGSTGDLDDEIVSPRLAAWQDWSFDGETWVSSCLVMTDLGASALADLVENEVGPPG